MGKIDRGGLGGCRWNSSGGGDRLKIKYADNQVVIAEIEEELQEMMERIKEKGEGYGMKINTSKSKVMKISKQYKPINVEIEGKKLEHVWSFKYLVSVITWNGNCTEEIKSRIAQGKVAYGRVKELLTARNINLTIRKRFAKCFVWSVILYGAETRMLRRKEEKYLEGFEMWLWRRMEGI
jgi:hypothetical protein